MDIDRYVESQMGWGTSDFKIGDVVEYTQYPGHVVRTVIGKIEGDVAWLDGPEVGGYYAVPIAQLTKISP